MNNGITERAFEKWYIDDQKEQLKKPLFEKLIDPSYFTVWDGYLETPISWIDGDRWIGDITEYQIDGDYNLIDGKSYGECLTEWISDNEDYLWDIYESWYESATETEIKEMEGC